MTRFVVGAKYFFYFVEQFLKIVKNVALGVKFGKFGIRWEAKISKRDFGIWAVVDHYRSLVTFRLNIIFYF